jgi:uncharacterized membrane protein YhaH (DUF805 family)
MDFLDLFSPQGRANRAWYFWHILLDDFVVLGLVIAMIVVSAIIGNPFLVIPMLGVILGGIWAAISITVKRLHDLGRPGWHFLLFMVPIYNLYLGLVLLLKRGTWGSNEYGPDPLRSGGPAGYLED